MKYFSEHKTHFLFLFGWLVLNLLQGYFTELAHDEAYYWMFGKYLDWGFFHHPPMVGVFSKIGCFFMEGELGVRLIAILANTLTIHVLFLLTDRKKPLVFWMIVTSMLIAHVGGWMLAPDNPLLLFTALFFYFVKRYFEGKGNRNLIVLGLIIPLLFYSKYHGVLVIGLVLLANLKIFKNAYFWLVVAISILVLLPHFLWHYQHDFPGLKFHLVDRFGDNFNVQHIFNYPLGQLLMWGPLVSFILVLSVIRRKSLNQFERTLKVFVFGVFAFFLVWSFKGRIEANWTGIAVVPLVYFTYAFLSDVEKWRTVYSYLWIPSILLVIFLRVDLVLPKSMVSNVFKKMDEFHGWDDFSKEVEHLADGKPIVLNGYALPSKLTFYTGKNVPSIYAGGYGNEFHFWKLDEEYQGKDVMFIWDSWLIDSEKITTPEGEELYFKTKRSYQNMGNIEVSFEDQELVFNPDKRVRIPIVLTLPEGVSISEIDDLTLSYHILDGPEYVVWDGERTPVITSEGRLNDKRQMIIEAELITPSEQGEYDLTVQLVTKHFIWWPNNNLTQLKITDGK